MNAHNFKRVRYVLWLILFANFFVAVLKIITGYITKSASLTADGFHSLSDGSSNIVGLIGIGLAAKPNDEDHPYGHGKYETLASLFIAGMLFFIGLKIIADSVVRFLNPVALTISFENLIVILITLAINIFVCTYEFKQGKILGSEILISDSIHTKSDIFISLGVIITLTCIKLGLPAIIDPLASLIVSGLILYSAYEIFAPAIGTLVDKAPVQSCRIKEIAMSFPEVKDTHKIRSRGNENCLFVDMHIMTEPDMSIEKSHILIHTIEERMREEVNQNVQVTAHFEPFI